MKTKEEIVAALLQDLDLGQETEQFITNLVHSVVDDTDDVSYDIIASVIMNLASDLLTMVQVLAKMKRGNDEHQAS